MKLIESKAEYIPQEGGLEGIYKQIELAGRTAYKSEDKMVDTINIDTASLPENITIEDIPNYKENKQQCIEYLCNHNIKYQVISSAKDFVDRMIKSKHGAALEHGTVYLYCKSIGSEKNAWFSNNPYSKVVSILSVTEKGMNGQPMYHQYITTNYRTIEELKCQRQLQMLCSPTEFHEKRYTMRFTCSRAISHELVRSRTMSFLQESTRYINYSKEHHGGEITFIKPSWLNVPTGIVYWHDGICWRVQQDENNPMEWFSVKPQEKFSEKEAQVANTYFDALSHAEKKYFFLLRENCQPQQARDVLPNATKTELVMTGFSSDWKRLLRLRLFEETGKVHPDMKVLMEKLKVECIKNEIWDDIINSDCKEI